MQILTVEITNKSALKVLQDLQEKHFINIIAQVDIDSPVFPGEPLTSAQFKELILSRENGPGMSLKEAKAGWAKKKKTTAEIRKIRVLEQAFQDIEQITDYIAVTNQQPLNAIKVGESIFAMINKIGQNPFAYRACEPIPTQTKIYRQAVCLSWHTIYKITQKEIIILGIIHTPAIRQK